MLGTEHSTERRIVRVTFGLPKRYVWCEQTFVF